MTDVMIVFIGLLTLFVSVIGVLRLVAIAALLERQLASETTTTECGPILTPQPELIAGSCSASTSNEPAQSPISRPPPTPDDLVRVLDHHGKYAGWVRRGSSKYTLIQCGAFQGMRLEDK